MSETTVIISHSVAVLIDGNNMERSIEGVTQKRVI